MSQTKIKNKITHKKIHEPVLLQEILTLLDPKEGERYLDLTAGYGGHASAILEATNSDAVLVDRDSNAIDELHKRFDERAADTRIVHDDFLHASSQLHEGKEKFDVMLADLGVSSPHLDNGSRGFSLLAEAPLDMRMDERQELTAEKVVNTYTAEKLTQIISTYGEEPKARRMAQLIIASRPLKNTTQLAEVAKKVWPGHSRTHPATRLFQAIRIEVNAELHQVEQVLPLLMKMLKPQGRLAVISFHSLEDRIVKRYFKSVAGDRYDAEAQLVTKRPVTASPTEIVNNPRSRSAKVRVVRAKK